MQSSSRLSLYSSLLGESMLPFCRVVFPFIGIAPRNLNLTCSTCHQASLPASEKSGNRCGIYNDRTPHKTLNSNWGHLPTKQALHPSMHFFMLGCRACSTHFFLHESTHVMYMWHTNKVRETKGSQEVRGGEWRGIHPRHRHACAMLCYAVRHVCRAPAGHTPESSHCCLSLRLPKGNI